MTFEIELGGRGRTVSVEPAGPDRYRVILDGHAQLVSARRIGEFTLSLIVDGGSGASYEVMIVPGGAAGEMLVGTGGRSVALTVNGRRRRRSGGDSAAATGEQKVTAPMPGRVVRLLVPPGEQIAARQGVIVVEAMKMENELRSPKAGRVKEVAVGPGAPVEAGSVLVVIE